MDFGFDFIHQLTGASKILDGIGIFFAEYLAYIFIVFFIVALFTRHHWRDRLYVFFFTLLSVAVSYGIVKEVINYVLPMTRPFAARGFTPLISHAASDPSFPSGHATFFFTLATVIFLQMSARWGIVAYLAALLIGLARVFVGVHYPMDIVAGAVIGMAIPLLVRAIMPKPLKEVEPEPEPVASLE